jgi:hypothetical protein
MAGSDDTKCPTPARSPSEVRRSLLFPSVPRNFPFRRSLRSALRVLHILTGGVLIGGVIFDQPPEALSPWLWGTVLSGVLLLATDLYASVAILCEVRGLAVLLKVALTALVPVCWESSLWLLIAALVVGAVSSHMPGRYRYQAWILRGRFVSDVRRG